LNLPSSVDVIVIGSGAAGLYATLCLPNNLEVALVTKDKLKKGASDWAQGGIAAAINPDDCPELHFQDTLKAGVGLCDRQAVKFLVENAASSIESLVEMGVAFDRKNNQLAMTLEAAHSRHRVLHAADTTGKAIVATLTEKLLQKSQVQVYEQAYALSLWLNPKGHCQGISVLYQGKISWLQASAVILATGGGGQVFAQTTNPKVSTGDGVALAWRSGAILRDLEFVQFHPTALNKPNVPHFLISEAVRGEGAHLIDASGRRFVFDYHPKGELAPRDVVSRAIFTHLHKTSTDPAHSHVYLDLRPIPTDKINYRFPNIIKRCQQWGIDLFNEPIPVSPAAHYWMGGIAVDVMNSTSIPGLYAVGETASTGVHGANRLASNSLLECLVFASQLRHLEVKKVNLVFSPPSSQILEANWQGEIKQFEDIRENLPVVVWEGAGICRTQEGLDSAIAQVNSWRSQLANLQLTQYIINLSPPQPYELSSPLMEQQLKLGAETLNLLDIGYLILKSAAFRTESRGGHYRLDYPELSAQWEAHTLLQGDKIWKSAQS
jgi:L-aspartate oxidase